MKLSELNEIIRKEPVCLWIGSGFSLYAGMPSAYDLKELLLAKLTQDERSWFNNDQDLRGISQDFEILRGRTALIQILKRRFEIPPVSTYAHDLLARIPYFKSIITTNYDKLIENSHTRKAAVILDDQDIFLSNMACPKIYKIHGDINTTGSIVLTRDDYSKHYNRIFKDPFWAAIIHEMSSKHIIFLGYGYEDENVWADFQHIQDKLVDCGRRRFFIGPSISHIKSMHLNRLGIEYIHASGEQFLMELINDIKANLRSDLLQGIVDAQVAQDFITGFDLKAQLQVEKNSTILVSLEKISGPTQQDVTFSISDPKAIESYKNFASNYEMMNLELTPAQVSEFGISIEGFNMLKQEELATFSLIHVPSYKGKCKIKFIDSPLQFNRVNVEVYNSVPGNTLIVLSLFKYHIKLRFVQKKDGFNVTFKITEPQGSQYIKDRYKVIRAINLFLTGSKVEIQPENRPRFTQAMPESHEVVELKEQLDLYSILLEVETEFNIKFPAIPSGGFSNEEFAIIKKLGSLIKNRYYAIKDPDGLTSKQLPEDKKLFDALCSVNTKDKYFFVVTKDSQQVTLFGKKIRLGAQQIMLREPSVVNADWVNKEVTLIPSDNIIAYYYERFGHRKATNSISLWEES